MGLKSSSPAITDDLSQVARSADRTIAISEWAASKLCGGRVCRPSSSRGSLAWASGSDVPVTAEPIRSPQPRSSALRAWIARKGHSVLLDALARLDGAIGRPVRRRVDRRRTLAVANSNPRSRGGGWLRVGRRSRLALRSEVIGGARPLAIPGAAEPRRRTAGRDHGSVCPRPPRASDTRSPAYPELVVHRINGARRAAGRRRYACRRLCVEFLASTADQLYRAWA